MQRLILYSHQNNNVLNEWQLLRLEQRRWNSIRSNWTNNKKGIVSGQDQSHTILRRATWDWWKEANVIFSGIFLSTTECYMIITNIIKTTTLEDE